MKYIDIRFRPLTGINFNGRAMKTPDEIKFPSPYEDKFQHSGRG